MSCYDLETLRRERQAGKEHRFVFFWRPTPEEDGSLGPGCLGQWWPGEFTVEGVTYRCAEQYMMAGKARMFGDREVLAQILAAAHPRLLKALGRKVRGFDEAAWKARRYQLVLEGNLAKFGQDPALKRYLLSTGDRILVEASPMDRIWGIGIGEQNPGARDPMKWKGQNLLGFALTQARDMLAGQE